jgi:hypothetical protein
MPPIKQSQWPSAYPPDAPPVSCYHKYSEDGFQQACKMGLEGHRVEETERALPVGPVPGLAQSEEPRQPRHDRRRNGPAPGRRPLSEGVRPPRVVGAVFWACTKPKDDLDRYVFCLPACG